MIETSVAEASDAGRVSALLTANDADRGGALMGAWPSDVIARRIAAGQPIVIAIDENNRLLGALLTSEKAFDVAPPVRAMLQAYPGDADAYVYGPVCIATEARGRGVLAALYARARAIHAGREAILFIREDNPRSLQAHLRLGMRVVAHFKLGDAGFNVLSDKAEQR